MATYAYCAQAKNNMATLVYALLALSICAVWIPPFRITSRRNLSPWVFPGILAVDLGLDFKLPESTLAFMAVNLFFTVIAEEAFFVASFRTVFRSP